VKTLRPPKGATPHERLSGFFHRLSKSGEFRLRYALEAKVTGLEVLHADDNLKAYFVGQEGGETRVMVRDQKEFDAKVGRGRWSEFFQWRALSADGLGGPTEAPKNSAMALPVELPEDMRETDFSAVRGGAQQARLGEAVVVSAWWSGENALWKVQPGLSPVKIVAGQYFGYAVTPDERWLVATKFDREQGGAQLVRFHVASQRSFKVPLRTNVFPVPVVFVPAHGKILLGPLKPEGNAATGGHWLLDPATGATQAVKGEFRPLYDHAARPLQPTGRPDEFWAMIHDPRKNGSAFGRYNARAFAFTPLVELPELEVNSLQTWVDAAAGKLYFIYSGHVLRLPLPK
jgi:hypothetical protein